MLCKDHRTRRLCWLLVLLAILLLRSSLCTCCTVFNGQDGAGNGGKSECSCLLLSRGTLPCRIPSLGINLAKLWPMGKNNHGRLFYLGRDWGRERKVQGQQRRVKKQKGIKRNASHASGVVQGYLTVSPCAWSPQPEQDNKSNLLSKLLPQSGGWERWGGAFSEW